jgi:hypothetical protein
LSLHVSSGPSLGLVALSLTAELAVPWARELPARPIIRTAVNPSAVRNFIGISGRGFVGGRLDLTAKILYGFDGRRVSWNDATRAPNGTT